MVDRPLSRASEDLRQLAYQQEAEAYREELVRYAREGAMLEDLRGTLEPLFHEALTKVVQEALREPEVRKEIQQEVSGAVVEVVRQQLALAQEGLVSQARVTLQEQWRQSADEVLRRVIKEALREQLSQEQISKYVRIALGKAPDEPGEFTPEAGKTGWWAKLRRPVLVGAGAIAAVFLVGFFLLLPWPASQKDVEDVGHEPQETTPSIDPISFPSSLLAKPAELEAIRKTWIDLMTAAEVSITAGSELAKTLQARPFSTQFTCWFGETARDRLDDLLAEPQSERPEFRADLQDAFDSCVDAQYGPPHDHLAIFGTQVTVLELLERRTASGWSEWCPKARTPNMSALAKFETDGFEGDSTYRLLNAFLTCTGLDSRLQIGPGSSTRDYLFTLYAALKELQSA